MRFSPYVALATIVVGLSLGAPARAEITDKGKSGGSGGDRGGSSGGGGASRGGTEGANVEYDISLRGGSRAGFTTRKWWEVGVNVEYHRLFARNDLGSDAQNKDLLYYLANVAFMPSRWDRILIRGGFTQRFIDDPGEPGGVRFDDITVSYTRTIALPAKLFFRVAPRVDIGTSYDSTQHESLIAAPRLGLSIERNFGPLNLYALGYGVYYIEKYTSFVGGANPTPKYRLATILEASVNMPFHKPLTIGVSGYFAVTWYNQTGSSNGGSWIEQWVNSLGTVSDDFTPNQPLKNNFGGEAYVRYVFPTYKGIYWDATLAFANGDPTIGYQGLLHDGVARFNLAYRHVAEGYLALNMWY